MNEFAAIILKVTLKYIGPAAKIFLERQAKHLDDNINFCDISYEEIPSLLSWIHVSAKLLIADDVNEYIKELVDELRKNKYKFASDFDPSRAALLRLKKNKTN
jgi:hypothetical protein